MMVANDLRLVKWGVFGNFILPASNIQIVVSIFLKFQRSLAGLDLVARVMSCLLETVQFEVSA